MVKILSQSGNSLADMYDVEGSIAGIDQLETRELPIVHEMGSTIFSERFSTFTRKADTGLVNQSTAFGVSITDLPTPWFKVFGISVLVDVTARLAFASLAIADPVTSREMPIWAWDAANDGEIQVRWSDDGAAGATTQFLQPAVANVRLPYMMAGNRQPQSVRELILRGQTTAFGAGTLRTTVLVNVGFAAVAGVSSRGLPLPSW